MKDTFQVEEDYFLLGNVGLYRVQHFLGEGTFGKVAKCKKLGTEEFVAIKIIKNKYKCAGTEEMKALEEIRQLDADEHNLVNFIEDFSYKNHTCVVFEMLEQSLYEFLNKRTVRLMDCNEIRPIAKQLLVALNGLKSIGLVHCDIKMDNIMLVDHQSQPFRIKLIDFGLARKAKDLGTGSKIQNICYRAPEVILGLPLDERLDLWTVGYILSYLYTGFLLHPKDCEYNVLRAMVAMQGMPDDLLLDQGLYTKEFFTLTDTTSGSAWELYSPEQYMIRSAKKIQEQIRPCTFQTLIDACGDDTMKNDAEQFVDLLKQMIAIDPSKRITPSEALKHPFFAMDQSNSSSGSPDSFKPATMDAQPQKEKASLAASSSSGVANVSAKTTNSSVPEDKDKNIVPSIKKVQEKPQTSSHKESLSVDGKTSGIHHPIHPHNDQLMSLVVKKCSASSDNPGDANIQSSTDQSAASAKDCSASAGTERLSASSSAIRTQLIPELHKTCRADLNEPGPAKEKEFLPVDNRTFTIAHGDESLSVDVKRSSASSDSAGDANIKSDCSSTDESYASAEDCLPPAGSESTPTNSSEMESYHSATSSIENSECGPSREKEESKNKSFIWIRNLYSSIMKGLGFLRKNSG